MSSRARPRFIAMQRSFIVFSTGFLAADDFAQVGVRHGYPFEITVAAVNFDIAPCHRCTAYRSGTGLPASSSCRNRRSWQKLPGFNQSFSMVGSRVLLDRTRSHNQVRVDYRLARRC